MDKNFKLAILSLCGLLASGCTSLSSKKLIDEEHTPSGLTYRLPAKLFSINATYEITDCENVGNKAHLQASVEATYTESLIGSEAYTINYQDLNAWTKVTNTEFQLSESGLLTGVNASIVDQSGPIILNTVSAAASIARAIATSGTSGNMFTNIISKSNEGEILCEKTDQALETMKAALSKLNAEKAKEKEREIEN